MNKIWEWHKKKVDWWKAKLGLDWYGVAWVSFFKGVLIVFLICILTGCTIGEKRIKILQVEEDIRWIIITSENAEEVFKKLEAAGIDPVLFGLTDKDYELLAKNFAQIRQKLQETNNLLEEYKKYYEGEEKK